MEPYDQMTTILYAHVRSDGTVNGVVASTYPLHSGDRRPVLTDDPGPEPRLWCTGRDLIPLVAAAKPATPEQRRWLEAGHITAVLQYLLDRLEELQCHCEAEWDSKTTEVMHRLFNRWLPETCPAGPDIERALALYNDLQIGQDKGPGSHAMDADAAVYKLLAWLLNPPNPDPCAVRSYLADRILSEPLYVLLAVAEHDPTQLGPVAAYMVRIVQQRAEYDQLLAPGVRDP